jgi:hypothetical protein
MSQQQFHKNDSLLQIMELCKALEVSSTYNCKLSTLSKKLGTISTSDLKNNKTSLFNLHVLLLYHHCTHSMPSLSLRSLKRWSHSHPS